MKTISHNNLLDELIGSEGTSERTNFENELNTEVLAYQFKELRKKKHITQSQLAEKMGVDKGKISKIENGKYNLTLTTINKLASTLGAKIHFSLEG